MKNSLFTPTIHDITYIEAPSKVPLFVDDGYYYGLSFFETVLVKKEPVFLHEHLARLNNSLSTFQLPIVIKEDVVRQCLRHYNIKNQGFKLHVSEKNILCSTRPLTYTDTFYSTGVRLTVSPIIRSSASLLVGHKSSNYSDFLLSLRKAKQRGFFDCLYFNEHGYLCETSIANLFIIKDHQLYTPSLDCGVLPGIIRNYLLNNYPVKEGHLTINDLGVADGVFLTNSLMGMVYVSELSVDVPLTFPWKKDPWPDKITYDPHPLYKKILKSYKTFINQRYQ